MAVALDGLKQEEALTVVKEVLSTLDLDESDIFNLRYRALLLVLRDLLAQGWIARYDSNRLELIQPDFTSAKAHNEEEQRQIKQRIQESMASECLAQLVVPSTRRFLQDMEDAPQRRGGRISVLELFADGPKLAADLERCLDLPPDQQLGELQKCIRPYLQLIQSEERCKHSGFMLMDIWRYMRYLWSLPNYSTPGRNLFYLVRDAARPYHPIIGIAAFSNSIVQITVRDDAIGWTLEALGQRVHHAQTSENSTELSLIGCTLLEALERGIKGIDLSDLEVTEEVCMAPSSEIITHLEILAQKSAENRLSLLQKLNGAERVKESNKSQPVAQDKLNEHLDELFRMKRARALSVLLQARRTFQAYGLSKENGLALLDLLKAEQGRQAIRTALKTNKQEKVGVNMLDLTTCGSVPPYSHLLGGKLVSLLVTSPEVVADYHARYGNSASEIASRMRGKDVARSAELVWIGTTSLYHVGSSQYNRIKMSAEVCGGDGVIEYKCLGETKGFGSVYYVQDTRQALDKVLIATHGASLINNEFGEGVNPKLRRIRSGLSAIGLDADTFLRHESRRIVYSVPLAKNAKEFLRGETGTPDYILPVGQQEANRRCTEQIANYWCTRWLASRLSFGPTISRVRATRSNELRVTNVLPLGPVTSVLPSTQLAFDFLETVHSLAEGATMKEPELNVEFVRTLYNNAKSYAEHLSGPQIEAIHVPMNDLEDFLVRTIESRKSVMLTGNPGDGKTYLIKRIRHLLPHDTVIETDATARNLDDIANRWQEAITADPPRPFLLAINEWPLLQLLSRANHSNHLPLQEVQEQLRNSIWYSREPDIAASNVLVLDMNLRSAAQDLIVRNIISKLTEEGIFKNCDRCSGQGECPVLANRRSLINPVTQERLLALLRKLRQRGVHVTMRDMQGCIAYLLTGGQSCDAIHLADDPNKFRYFNLLFDPEANSDLIAALRGAFDPAAITHPDFDELLWTGDLPADAWRENVRPGELPYLINKDDALQAFKEKYKRRFYFETQDQYGPKLLNMLPPAEQEFEDLLRETQDNPEAATRRLVRLINRFYDPLAPGVGDDELRLWTSFRYQISPAQVYISTSNILSENLHVYLPKLAPWLESALGRDYLPDHLLLSLEPDRVELAQLLVDINLFRTLRDAQEGKPVALRPPQTLRRLEAFFGQLRSLSGRKRDSEDILICDITKGDRFAFRLDRRHLRYEKELS